MKGSPSGGRPPRLAIMSIDAHRLTHLRQLEAESIHIIREVAAEFEKPVMLYSIGKDSSVLVRLAIKAFHPAKLPFPLMHIDTTWKFRDMIAFRDRFCARERPRPDRAHQPGRRREEASTRSTTAARSTPTIMKTQALVAGAADARLRRGVRRRAPRRGEVARQGARLLLPRQVPAVGSEEPAARAVEPVQRPRSTRARASACSRCRTGPSSTLAVHLPGEHPDRAAVLRAAPRPWSSATAR